jgi:hypothetical protein
MYDSEPNYKEFIFVLVVNAIILYTLYSLI